MRDWGASELELRELPALGETMGRKKQFIDEVSVKLNKEVPEFVPREGKG